MRWSFSKALLCASLLTPILAVPAAEKAAGTKDSDQVALKADDSKAADAKDTKDTSDGSTYFNELRVPPITMLDGGKFADEIKDGYW